MPGVEMRVQRVGGLSPTKNILKVEKLSSEAEIYN
jgi:hypothetical protein